MVGVGAAPETTSTIAIECSACITRLHSMAMVEVISGETQTPTKPEELHELVDMLWDHLKPHPPAPGADHPKSPRAKKRG